jgi:hypothetical protein
MDETIDTPVTSSGTLSPRHLVTADEERARNNAISDHEERRSRYQRRMAELEQLGDDIATLSTQIQAATHQLLMLIAEFDRREGWSVYGARSCAHWLVWRTGLAPGAAREWVRVARVLELLPVISEGLRRGQISFSKVRALTRIATPETDQPLFDLAQAGTAAQVEKIVRACRRCGPQEERDKERWVHAMRYLEVSRDEDGMYVLRGRLDPEAGAVLMRALDAGGEVLYQRRKNEEQEDGARESDREPARSSDPRSIGRSTDPDGLTAGQRRADALGLIAESALAGGMDPGTRGDRYQVVIHVDQAALQDSAEQGVSALEDRRHVPAEMCRRVACDAATVVMTHAPDGSVLDVGRRTRTISPALRRALVQRDGGCRFPGCGLSLCDAHHVEHWAAGGETSLENTALLCRFHHRLVHAEAFQLKRLADGELEFRRPDGRLLPDSWLPPPPPVDPFEALLKRLEDGGIEVDPHTSTPYWDGGPWELGEAVSWILETAAAEQAKRAAGGEHVAGPLSPGVDVSVDAEPVPDAEPFGHSTGRTLPGGVFAGGDRRDPSDDGMDGAAN